MEKEYVSILEKYKLTKENFENAITVGLKKNQLLLMYQKTSAEMNEWCEENFGIKDFDLVYEIIRATALQGFHELVEMLGARGNPTALNILNQALSEESDNQVNRIVFDVNVRKETDDDKKCD